MGERHQHPSVDGSNLMNVHRSTTSYERLQSLDAYRGFVMLAMASAGLGIPQVAKSYPESGMWQAAAYQFDHVAWTGCSFWDLIQPSFMFIVGVAIPFSYGRRAERGASFGQMLRHALSRSMILVLLGVFLASNGKEQTNFLFTNVLAQIGLGYTIVFLIGRNPYFQFLAALAIICGSWYAFDRHPLPTQAQLAEWNLPADWEKFPLDSPAARWNPHTNFAAECDRRLLNRFPRSQPFVYERGGYQTLNFVPSIATMVFGAMVGTLLRGGSSARGKFNWLLGSGFLCLVVAMGLDHTIWPDWLNGAIQWTAGWFGAASESVYFLDRNWTQCPIVKRIWTPTWAVFSTGWTLLFLAGFFYLIELRNKRGWAFPLVVVGMNSITIYLLAQLVKPWIWRTIKTHCGYVLHAIEVYRDQSIDTTFLPMVEQCSVLIVLWLVCYWLYRKNIFLRI